jgi:hypothetical protein
VDSNIVIGFVDECDDVSFIELLGALAAVVFLVGVLTWLLLR